MYNDGSTFWGSILNIVFLSALVIGVGGGILAGLETLIWNLRRPEGRQRIRRELTPFLVVFGLPALFVAGCLVVQR